MNKLTDAMNRKNLGYVLFGLAAPAIALGLLSMMAFGRTTRGDVWEWMGENEWFCLSMLVYLAALSGYVEFVL